METAEKVDSPDVPYPAVPIRTAIPLVRRQSRTVTVDTAVRPRAARPPESAAQPQESAVQESAARESAAAAYCAQCRHAKFDRLRSLCLCRSPVSEFARRQVFSGQEACGWFEQRGRRSPSWPLFSARKL